MKKMRLAEFFKTWAHRLNYGAVPGARRIESPSETDYTKPRRVWINILLFIITFITTSLAQSNQGGTLIETFISGLPYSCTLMLILATHEFGHYFAARSFGVNATLPYFIPFPSLIGTLGAVIKTRTPIPGRRALFYIGAMGPLPGFIVSLAAVSAGIYMSTVRPVIPAEPGSYLMFGDSFLFRGLIRLFHGNIAAGSDLFLHPVAFAGWIGFLLTSLNLMPVGQLDGGHILHALIGNRQRYAGWIFLAALAALSFYWPGWIVWVIIILFVVMVGHPEIHGDAGELSPAEKVTGWICMLILVLTFIPVPVTIV